MDDPIYSSPFMIFNPLFYYINQIIYQHIEEAQKESIRKRQENYIHHARQNIIIIIK